MRPLTRTQLQILELISLDVRDGDIAAERGVATTTVRTHVASALRRLNVHSRAAAVGMCLREGWIT
jgi:DNA-binding NarL/FixJ family response regulator